jgi:hypothetical protein
MDVLRNAAGNHGGLQARDRRPQVVVGIDEDAVLLCYHCEIQQRRPDFLMLTRPYAVVQIVQDVVQNAALPQIPNKAVQLLCQNNQMQSRYASTSANQPNIEMGDGNQAKSNQLQINGPSMPPLSGQRCRRSKQYTKFWPVPKVERSG